MSPDPPFDILFQPIEIGPVTARNRFYQVPHCTGMGYRDPTALAHMRGVKAEGGWAVVCTEQVEFHWSSEITPFIELRLWDDRDIPMLAGMADQIHAHGALAGLELAYNGLTGPNLYSREVPMAPTGLPIASFACDPVQARTMDKEDIRNIRRWHKAAALRAKRAEFDLIYVYAGHALSFLHHFLSREFNHRTDEYGGSLENRVRLLKELLIDTREAVGDRCAVPCRLSVDELRGADGLEKAESEDMIGLVAEIPDLWDVCLAGWENDSLSSRFGEEGWQEPFIAGVKTADHEARGGCRPLYLPRPHGFHHSQGHRRSDRLRAALHRRSVSASKDRRGTHRGHPRVHRLQHLRVGRFHNVAYSLHPESDHGRGMAPGLASGIHPAEGERQTRLDRRRGSRRP